MRMTNLRGLSSSIVLTNSLLNCAKSARPGIPEARIGSCLPPRFELTVAVLPGNRGGTTAHPSQHKGNDHHDHHRPVQERDHRRRARLEARRRVQEADRGHRQARPREEGTDPEGCQARSEAGTEPQLARDIAATRKALQKVGRDRAAHEARGKELAAAERDTIVELRKLGVTWKTIGEDLGMSGVWLQRKHRDLGA